MKDEIEVTAKMIDAGAMVIPEMVGEVSKRALAEEAYRAMEGIRVRPNDGQAIGKAGKGSP
jgi:hypothetical protein